MVESLLDDVPGLGEVRRKACCRQFGSLQASCGPPRSRRSPRCPGIGPRTAEAIVAALAEQQRPRRRSASTPRPARSRSPDEPRPREAAERARPSRRRDHRGELVVVTGMTGAGRSTAAKELEDLGFFVVDNLPPQLVADVVRLVDETRGPMQPIAVVVDVRSGSFFAGLQEVLAQRHAPAGAPRCCSSRPTTRCWSAGRRPPAARTRCRRAAGCSTASPRARRCSTTCAPTPTWSSTPPPQRAPAHRQGRRGLRHRADHRAAGHGASASASSTASRSTPTWSPTCASCPTRTGCPSCAR